MKREKKEKKRAGDKETDRDSPCGGVRSKHKEG